ncbi:hypothetical protein HanPSC8_Chr10g0423581 [Helianthus annuus]|nr:hypothetical protein HanPSC8_Chr10g0423581 [Helianthus annuus]
MVLELFLKAANLILWKEGCHIFCWLTHLCVATPSEWRKTLSNPDKDVILLDVRNAQDKLTPFGQMQAYVNLEDFMALLGYEEPEQLVWSIGKQSVDL